MKKNITLIILLIILSQVYSQDSINNIKRVVSFSPQYLFNYGIRVDFERKLTANKWLVLAPQIYLADKSSGSTGDNTGSSDFNLMVGTGLTAGVKNYARGDTRLGAYLGYGLFYNYYYTEYYEDFENEVVEATADIQKFGFDITLGYQFIIKEIATLDLYTGMGLRKSVIDNGDFSNDKFGGYPTGFNITGNIILLGIKIGILY